MYLFTSVRSAKLNGPACVDIVEIFFNVLKAQDNVFIWKAAPLSLDGVSESLSVTGAASRVGRNNDISLLGKHSRVPSSAPAILPAALGSTVDEICEGVLLSGREIGRLDDPSVDLSAFSSARVPDLRDLAA